jgi:hypothetical protein
MLRVALGRARPDSEWSMQGSKLQFGSSPATRSRGRGYDGTTSTIGTVSRDREQGPEGALEAGSGVSESQERFEDKKQEMVNAEE